MKIEKKIQLRKIWPLLVVFFLTFGLMPTDLLAYKIGIITDIHAGKRNISRKSEYNSQNILLAKKYPAYFKQALRRMKKSGVNTVITTGDNTNDNSPKYAKKLLRLTRQSGVEVLWGRGNHEGFRTDKYLFPAGKYYAVDRGNWRIIFLDSNEGTNNKSVGGVGPTQKLWLRDRIAETERNILVVMHHPIFRIRDNLPGDVYADYQELESIFSESGRVKEVVSGHVHINYLFETTLNGVRYSVSPPLMLRGHLGSYRILDLP